LHEVIGCHRKYAARPEYSHVIVHDIDWPNRRDHFADLRCIRDVTQILLSRKAFARNRVRCRFNSGCIAIDSNHAGAGTRIGHRGGHPVSGPFACGSSAENGDRSAGKRLISARH
jgi:hypothetical protein